MAEQERNTTNQDQPAAQHKQGAVTISPDPEKIRKIAINKTHTAKAGDTAPGHPDVEQEKNAARSTNNANSGEQERIINPKNNSSNQYR